MPFDNKALTRRWFEEVWNKRREETIDEMIGPGGIIHGLAEGGEDLRAPGSLSASTGSSARASPTCA